MDSELKERVWNCGNSFVLKKIERVVEIQRVNAH